tara:strand:- start:914 stop:1444 length:531 start_codon:yes stop_codon:yes gene_type:complete
MKNLLFLLTVLLTLSCCNNDDDSAASLPPETQTGANTVGCLVNGKVFLPHAEGINSPVNCFYQFVNGEFYFNLHFADLRGVISTDVVVQTSKITLEVGKTYILNKNIVDDGDFTGGGVFAPPSIIRFYTTTIKTGELRITRVDVQNSILSGTFWFDAVNTKEEIAEIREGRFDWNY